MAAVAAMALFSATAFAESTIIWQEDWTGATAKQTPSEINSAYTQSSSKDCIYNENLALGTAPELLVGRNSGKFTVTGIDLKGQSGDLTLRFKSNKGLTVSSTTTGVTFSEPTKTGNDYQYTVTVPSGTTTMDLVFSNTTKNNSRLDDIVFYAGTMKSPAGLSWGTAARSVTLGSTSNNFPTLSNTNNLDVTYSSSNTEVATIDAEGNITLVAGGKTTISAAFAGNDNYEAQTASYELTVEDNSKPVETYTAQQIAESIAAGTAPSGTIRVSGKISKISEVSTKFGNATFYISEDGSDTNALKVYRCKYLGGEKFTSEDQVVVGAKVVVEGKLSQYNGSYELASSTLIEYNGVTNGLSKVTTNSINAAKVYNVAGQQVSAAAKGLVIVNGKKYLRK
jgi:hypothetical protein